MNCFIISKKTNFQDYDYLCGVRLINGNHWCGFFVDFNTNVFRYFDPYRVSETENQEVFSCFL